VLPGRSALWTWTNNAAAAVTDPPSGAAAADVGVSKALKGKTVW